MTDFVKGGKPTYTRPKGLGNQHNNAWHKSSQDTNILNKDDRMLDDDNNIRKDADVNLDSRESKKARKFIRRPAKTPP